MKLYMPRWLTRVEFLNALDHAVLAGDNTFFGDVYARLNGSKD